MIGDELKSRMLDLRKQLIDVYNELQDAQIVVEGAISDMDSIIDNDSAKMYEREYSDKFEQFGHISFMFD